MRIVRNTCLDFFNNNDIRRDIKDFIRPIVSIIYNEIYLYIWLLCFYNIFLILIVLANLIIIIRLMKKINHTI